MDRYPALFEQTQFYRTPGTWLSTAGKEHRIDYVPVPLDWLANTSDRGRLADVYLALSRQDHWLVRFVGTVRVGF